MYRKYSERQFRPQYTIDGLHGELCPSAHAPSSRQSQRDSHGYWQRHGHFVAYRYFVRQRVCLQLCAKYVRHADCDCSSRLDIHQLVGQLHSHRDQHRSRHGRQFHLHRNFRADSTASVHADDHTQRNRLWHGEFDARRYCLWKHVHFQLCAKYVRHADCGCSGRLDIHRLDGQLHGYRD